MVQKIDEFFFVLNILIDVFTNLYLKWMKDLHTLSPL